MTNAKAAVAMRQLLLICASTCVATQKVVGNYSCCFLVRHTGSNIIALVKNAHGYTEENKFGGNFRHSILLQQVVLHCLLDKLG